MCVTHWQQQPSCMYDIAQQRGMQKESEVRRRTLTMRSKTPTTRQNIKRQGQAVARPFKQELCWTVGKPTQKHCHGQVLRRYKCSSSLWVSARCLSPRSGVVVASGVAIAVRLRKSQVVGAKNGRWIERRCPGYLVSSCHVRRRKRLLVEPFLSL